MNVVYIIEEAKLGGPQVQMARVAEALRDRAEIHLLIPKGNNELFRQLCDDLGLTYSVINISRLTREIGALFTFLWRSPLEVLSLVRQIKREKPDLIHAWGGAWQVKAAIVAWLCGVPLVWLLNDTELPRCMRLMFRMVARLCPGFIFASHASRRYYEELVPTGAQTVVVQSMVDLNAFNPRSSYSSDAELISTWAGDFVVGLVSNISPVKGIETFVRVAARARAAKRACRFVVVGSIYNRQQGLYQELMALAKELGADNLSFVGGRQDVRALLKRFDVYLCTSRSESSPVSVWEALAMECPVVSTAVGDVPDFVVNGDNGFIAPVGDDLQLWHGVERLMDDPSLAEVMGQRSRARAGRAFGRTEIAERTCSFYSEVLAASRKPA